ncbi:NAD(P)-binding protein [Piedraia hortae CBS 480.64]|uniref:NAD(P)-binding protein n=1 Tax=Piedraia hortae CBS 480.64 TaxID=1314780 RepID=A0A6A7BY77_9PEZI|nr:NAD(P)-binding protein [Piedraia hortae CBS 480.64]
MSNSIRNVAIIGAGSNLGQHIVHSLLQTDQHTITAITRETSQTPLPPGLHKVIKVNYASHPSLVKSLQDIDALIIILSPYAPAGTSSLLITAALEARVRFILPDEWGADSSDAGLNYEIPAFATKGPLTQRIIDEGYGITSAIPIATNFWFEFSVAIPDACGFDFEKRRVTFFDDGKTTISASTWVQIGRAVKGLLSLPTQGQGLSLERFANKRVFVDSFRISQREIFESVLRVTGTEETEWTIQYERARERYEAGKEAMEKGDQSAFIRMMYARVWFKDGGCDFEGEGKFMINELLGLPREDLDEATKRAIERARRQR